MALGAFHPGMGRPFSAFDVGASFQLARKLAGRRTRAGNLLEKDRRGQAFPLRGGGHRRRQQRRQNGHPRRGHLV